MLLDKLCKFICRTAVGKRTTCRHIGHQYLFAGTKHLCRLTHEVNAAHHNNVGFRFCRPLRQSQTVSNVVGYVLYLTLLVVVPQNDRILLFLQLLDSFYQIIHNNNFYFSSFFKNPLIVMIGC